LPVNKFAKMCVKTIGSEKQAGSTGLNPKQIPKSIIL